MQIIDDDEFIERRNCLAVMDFLFHQKQEMCLTCSFFFYFATESNKVSSDESNDFFQSNFQAI